MDARSEGLEVRWRWGDQLLAVEQLATASLRDEVRLGRAGLPQVRVRRDDDGALVLVDGTHLDGFAQLRFGSVVAELALTPRPPRAKARWDERFESGWWNALIVSALAIFAVVIAAPAQDPEVDDAGFLQRTAPHVVKIVPQVVKPVVAEAPMHSAKPAASASRAHATRKPSKKPGFDAKHLFDGGALGSVFGPGGLEGSLAKAASGLGKVAGSGGGPFGGLGLRGGSGGPSVGSTFSIGAVPGHGRDYGVGAGKLCEGSDCKGHPKFEIEPEPPTIAGSLDRDLIREVIHRNHAAIRFCYEQALISDPSLNGRVDVHFVIGSEGSVIQSNVASSTLNAPALEGCLRAKFGQMLFPKPKGGGIVDVRYPVVLTQAGK